MKYFLMLATVSLFSNLAMADKVKMRCRTKSINEVVYVGSTSPLNSNKIGQQVLWINEVPQKQHRFGFSTDNSNLNEDKWILTVSVVQDKVTLKDYSFDFSKANSLNPALEISERNVSSNSKKVIETGYCLLSKEI